MTRLVVEGCGDGSWKLGWTLVGAGHSDWQGKSLNLRDNSQPTPFSTLTIPTHAGQACLLYLHQICSSSFYLSSFDIRRSFNSPRPTPSLCELYFDPSTIISSNLDILHHPYRAPRLPSTRFNPITAPIPHDSLPAFPMSSKP